MLSCLLQTMRYFIVLLFLVAAFRSHAQSSVIHDQADYYAGFGVHADSYWDSVRLAEGAPANVQAPITVQGGCSLTKRVFGWHPYWVGTVYNNYQWNLLSDLCYYDYDVSPNTGNNTNASYNWMGSGAVTAAISNG